MQRHERFAHFLNKKQQQNTDALKVQNIQRKSVVIFSRFFLFWFSVDLKSLSLLSFFSWFGFTWNPSIHSFKTYKIYSQSKASFVENKLLFWLKEKKRKSNLIMVFFWFPSPLMMMMMMMQKRARAKPKKNYTMLVTQSWMNLHLHFQILVFFFLYPE